MAEDQAQIVPGKIMEGAKDFLRVPLVVRAEVVRKNVSEDITKEDALIVEVAELNEILALSPLVDAHVVDKRSVPHSLPRLVALWRTLDKNREVPYRDFERCRTTDAPYASWVGESESERIEAHRLGGVIEKFNRSKQQFDVLRTEIGEFLDQEPEPHFSRGEFDSDTWEWIERFQMRKPPLRWGVILGDCVHNLRSALDHLICQVTLLDGGTMGNCAQAQFPIASKSERQFERMAKRRLPACFSEKHRAMVKGAQPYRAGDGAATHPLTILATLSNADKHRVINATYSFMDSDPGEVLDRLAKSYQGGDEPSPVHSWWMLKRGQRLEQDTPWFRIVFDRALLTEAPVKVEMGGNISLGIAFGEIGLDSRDFRKVAEYVWLVIEGFMREFPETVYHD
jgi:hypothetical protein